MHVDITVQNLPANVSVLATTHDSSPNFVLLDQKGQYAHLSSPVARGLRLYAYIKRINDSGLPVSHTLGFHLATESRRGSFAFVDYTDPEQSVTVQVYLDVRIDVPVKPLTLEDAYLPRRALEHISPYGDVVPLYKPSTDSLDRIHSPYYDTVFGTRLPSGAFTCIPTCWRPGEVERGRQVFQARFEVSCTRFGRSPRDWQKGPRDVTFWSIVADTITCHARERMKYTPDVCLKVGSSESYGTERWEVPRTIKRDGTVCFSGDCEDYAREVIQSYDDFMTCVVDDPTKPIGYLRSILQDYAAVMMQGAVGGEYHSKYVTEPAKYRNHIWGALIPKARLLSSGGTDKPVLLCDATGFEVPVFGEHAISSVHLDGDQQSPSIPKEFYKICIKCMTNAFKSSGILEFLFVTKQEYGCPFDDWWAGNFTAVPAYTLTSQEMMTIEDILSYSRPIPPVLDIPVPSDSDIHHGTIIRQSKYQQSTISIPKHMKSTRTIQYKHADGTMALETTVEWFV